tara:strand:+ start:1426 stop:1758 length:333 start_codon:yes stop_codon:yes gene_type:complete
MKIPHTHLKQTTHEESRSMRSMPEIVDVIKQGYKTMDLVEIINEAGARVAQNHYNLIQKYDMGSMDLAADMITEFESALKPYLDDCFGEGQDHSKVVQWLDEAIRDELEG